LRVLAAVPRAAAVRGGGRRIGIGHSRDYPRNAVARQSRKDERS
jgi:hypothetical protein